MDRRQQKTRTAIYDALTKLLRKRRFEDITVQEIIDEANIGRSTFYSHFETKDQLLEQMCDEMFSHVFSESLMPEKSHDFSANHEEMKALLEHILWHIKDHEDNISSIMYGESEKLFTRYFSRYLEDAFGDMISHIDIDVLFSGHPSRIPNSFCVMPRFLRTCLICSPNVIIPSSS